LKTLKTSFVYKDLFGNIFSIVIGIVLAYSVYLNFLFFILEFIYLIYLFKTSKLILILVIIISTIFILILLYLDRNILLIELNSIEGKIININEYENSNRLLIKFNNVYYYVFDNEKLDLYIGDIINVKGEYVKTYPNRIFESFDYKDYLISKKIVGRMNADSINIVTRKFNLLRIKSLIFNHVDNNFSDISRKYIYSLVLNDSSLFDEEFKTVLRINSISHMFVVSGFHINIFIMSLDKLFKKFKRRNVFISLFLAFYVFITYFAAAVTRAVFMWYVKEFLKFIKLEFTSLDCLSICFIIMVLFNPYYIKDLGFILSFLCTAIIILCSKFISGNKIKAAFLISLFIGIVCLPITIKICGFINILAPILNCFYTFYFSLLIPFSLVFMILSPLSMIYNYYSLITLEIMKLSSNLSILVYFPLFNGLLVLVYYFVLFLLIKACRGKIKLLISFSIYVLVFIGFSYSGIKKSNEVVFYDLKSGESTLIKTAYDECVALIDTGGSLGSNELISSLHYKGVRKIDYIFLTHSDEDHVGSLDALSKEFKVINVVKGKYDRTITYTNEIILNKSNSFKCSDLTFNVDFEDKIHMDNNDNSLIISVNMGGLDFLFLGDASNNLDDFIISKRYKCDVLKITHHGSKTGSSSKLLYSLNPKYAIIMASQNKQFNFPHIEVVERLKLLNIEVYQTNIHYSIMFVYDKKGYKFITCG